MSSGSTGGRRAERLLLRNAKALTQSQKRPLVAKMADGTVSNKEYGTYLAIEQGFVRTAARILGFCIWQEPDWDIAVEHARSLASLVGDQSDYFAIRTPSLAALPEGADALETVVDDAVADGYAAVVVCLFAAETLYSRWCAKALETHGSDLSGPAADWILLHTTTSFTKQVAFLASLVDRIDPAFVDGRLDHWFGRMLAAEDTFHDSAIAKEPLHD